MQNNSDHKKSYDYFLAFVREALREKVFSISEENIRQIARDEFISLLQKQTENGLNSEPFSSSILSKQTPINSKIGWLKGEGTLLKFYNLLIAHGYIACDFEIFRFHFIEGKGIIEPVMWLSYTKRLVYLFDLLSSYKFIPECTTVHQLLKEHFVDRQGQKLKNGSLRSSLNQVRNDKRIQIIENIILQLEKNKD